MVFVRVETEEAQRDTYARDIEDQVYIRHFDFDFIVPLARRALADIHDQALDQVCLMHLMCRLLYLTVVVFFRQLKPRVRWTGLKSCSQGS
jgi:hypothetical protein